jgi:heme oxygenase
MTVLLPAGTLVPARAQPAGLAHHSYQKAFAHMTAALHVPTLSRLRSETREQHDAIEKTLLLMDDDLTLETYRRQLEQFYGFYKPVEERLFKRCGPLAAWLAVEQRRKTALLQADLSALGHPAVARLPLCTELPSLVSSAECFGCLYVLEGATLGGMIISRHVQLKLGVTPSAGAAFFGGYGDQTGAMWQQFRAAITAFSTDEDDQDVVVASARTTFLALQKWCHEGQNA